MFKRISGTIVLVLALVLVGQVVSQAKENSLKAGAWALQFRVVSRDKDLTSYEGTSLSIKRHTSSNWAWKLGVSAAFFDQEGDEIVYRADTLYRNIDDYNNAGGFNIVVQRLWYPKPKVSPTMFIGLGPLYEHSYSSYFNDDLMRTIRRDRSVNTFGIAAVIGMELFVSKSISFSADYSSTLKWSNTNEVNENLYKGGPASDGNGESNTDSVRLSVNSVRVGLSIYF